MSDPMKNPYYPGARFQAAREGAQIRSKYDQMTPELVDLQKRDVVPFTIVPIDLSAAGTQEIVIPGRGFTGFIESGGVPVAGRVGVRVNQNKAEQEFPLRNGRGFRGDFVRLYLTWAAQANVTLELMIFHFDDMPYPSVT